MNAQTLPQTTAFFLARGESALFCLLHSPPAGVAPLGGLVHVPAFAEEMNKARRAVSIAARALAQRGWHVLLVDLTGTGDSSGDFADAAWETWVDDVCHAANWLHAQTRVEVGLWGLRSGCLLACDALVKLECQRLLLWQPQISGETALGQFLRLRTMSGIASDGQSKESTKTLAADLEAGCAIEVAGYALAPKLALAWRRARIESARFGGRRVSWLEVAQSDPPALAPASETCIASMQAHGASVNARAVHGLSFWMTQEIDECRALTAATLECMAGSA